MLCICKKFKKNEKVKCVKDCRELLDTQCVRLDKELHLRGLAKSRTAAADLITGGGVTVNGAVCSKASLSVSQNDVIEVIGERLRYVSRGGLKLEHALDTYGIDLQGKVCLDIGASTGGFTDCMLQRGAARVYAVDVGTNQLDTKLREDSRVVSLENCDIRKANVPQADFTAVDVSFISVKLILPFVKSEAVVLIKPQFEFGRKHKGVIRDCRVHERIVSEVAEFTRGLGFKTEQPVAAPVSGGSGNREFLMWVKV
jgi:23S rRNA (cytidine1920-2'-O)/16S rRNA (cytidine1409-2'-O)-methyltransferase